MKRKDGHADAPEIKFLHTRKTARGEAVLVTETAEAAEWIRKETHIGSFAERLGGQAQARADLFMVIAEFVPTSFNPDAFINFKHIERTNGLRNGAIREA